MADMNIIIALSETAQIVQRALAALDAGGKIIGMSISEESEENSVYVPTTDMQYPQAMVDNIKGSLHERLNQISEEIRTELAKIGEAA